MTTNFYTNEDLISIKEETVPENRFLQVLQALNYFNVFQDIRVLKALHLALFDELLDGLNDCDDTSCEDTVRIRRIDD